MTTVVLHYSYRGILEVLQRYFKIFTRFLCLKRFFKYLIESPKEIERLLKDFCKKFIGFCKVPEKAYQFLARTSWNFVRTLWVFSQRFNSVPPFNRLKVMIIPYFYKSREAWKNESDYASLRVLLIFGNGSTQWIIALDYFF